MCIRDRLTAAGGIDATGTVTANNSLIVTEFTTLNGAVTVNNTVTATTYNLGALAALPA